MKRFMLSLAILLSLATLSMAEIVITTADGNGADTMISNDGNKSYTYVGGGGSHLEVRHYDGVRAKASMFRLDISDGFAGDLSGAYFQVYQHSSTRSRQLSLYVLADGEWDNWDEGTVSYNTFPGIIEPYDNSGNFNYDTTMWTRVAYVDAVSGYAGTLQSYDSTGEPNAPGNIDLSFIDSDTNGLVTFMLWKDSTDSSYDAYYASKESDVNSPAALVFPNARFAADPNPADNGEVGTIPSALSWTNAAPLLEGGIITCDVYFGTVADRSQMAMVTTGADENSVALSSFTTSLTPGTYYWAVDTYDTSSDPNGLGEPTSLGEGYMWSFNYTLAPTVVTNPTGAVVALGEDVELSAEFDSAGLTTYSWYHSDDAGSATLDDDYVVGGDSTTLTLTAVTGADEGYYYCKAVNASGEANAAYTDTAGVGVQRQTAHWSLDEVSGGVFADSSGNGNDLTPANAENVSFAAGAKGQAIIVDPNSIATGGSFDPARITDAFTIAMWVKWDGTNASFQNILSKTDTWAADDMQFQIGLNSSDNVTFLSTNDNSYSYDAVTGEWDFIAVVYDSGTSTIYRAPAGDVNFTINTETFSLSDDATATFALGGLANGEEAFNGQIDDVQVFNYAKNAVEIADLYNEVDVKSFCLLEYASVSDLNGDCEINIGDFSIVALNWLECGLYPACP
jgi:hypothetical protein